MGFELGHEPLHLGEYGPGAGVLRGCQYLAQVLDQGGDPLVLLT